MSLKSDLIWDKLNSRLAQVDRSKRSFKAILFIHLQQSGKTVRSVVLDCNELKIVDIDIDASYTNEYPSDRIDASITIDDNDFYLVTMKETTFADLIEKMSLKSDLIWDKLNSRLAQVDRSKRSFKAILFIHLQQSGKTVRSVVLDCNELKIVDIDIDASYTNEYPSDRIDASITIDDNDFYLVTMKETTFAALIEKNNVTVVGNKDCFLKLDEKFMTK
ncbi:uncharacterized protein LOC131440466 isoform X2 [Malaya genurostris]|uniref:uncharacterized protein LOC131440466 isoform X2 n=1 Tax=Malaya genurostris TaxID=325434 RepID=UPI0026F3EE3D|nr:uncharacterized protein LOC131440466 isoform X2 [Malaya genurostris]